MELIKKVIQTLSFYLKKIRVFILRKNKNIQIGKNVLIYSNCKFATGGGKISIGDNCEILYGVCLLTYGGNIIIGNNCSINPYTIIYGHGKGTKIGNNVLIAGHCMIIPSNHIFEDPNITIDKQGATSKGILIGDDVWIGTGVKILDGVTIGKGSVIAAGAVVTKSIEPYTVSAGIPAKKIKDRN